MSINTMTYKGYSALIEYSDEDECLIGRVVGINDIIVFDGENIGEVRQRFHDGLDNYLALCEKNGKQPEVPKSGKLSVRIPAELHAFLSKQSEVTGESVNGIILGAVESMRNRVHRSETRMDTSKGRKGKRSEPALAQ